MLRARKGHEATHLRVEARKRVQLRRVRIELLGQREQARSAIGRCGGDAHRLVHHEEMFIAIHDRHVGSG